VAQGLAWLLATLLIGSGGVADLVDDEPEPTVDAPEVEAEAGDGHASVEAETDGGTGSFNATLGSNEASDGSTDEGSEESPATGLADTAPVVEVSEDGVRVEVGDYELQVPRTVEDPQIDPSNPVPEQASEDDEDAEESASAETARADGDEGVPTVAIAAPAAAAAGAAATATAVTSSSLPGWLRRLLGVPTFSALYSRIEPDEVLDHDTRAEIYEVLTDEPGQSLQAVCEQLDVARSTARHHVRKLEEAGLVDHAKVGRSRVHFPAGGKAQALKRHLLDHDTRSALARALSTAPGTISELAERLDVNPGSVHFHLDKLEEADLVEVHESGHTEYRAAEALQNTVAFQPVNA